MSGASGRRLAALCGTDLASFLATFERVNLVPAYPGKNGKGDSFPRAAARAAAAAIDVAGRPVVLLGRNVAAAFGVRTAWMTWHDGVAVAPHPSGISHWWNTPANVGRARRFWRELMRRKLHERFCDEVAFQLRKKHGRAVPPAEVWDMLRGNPMIGWQESTAHEVAWMLNQHLEDTEQQR